MLSRLVLFAIVHQNLSRLTATLRQLLSISRSATRSPLTLCLTGIILPLVPQSVRAVDSVVVFNEIMYHPADQEQLNEWIELRNEHSVAVDLSNWSIDGGIDFRFPEGSIIPGMGYLVIALAPEYLLQTTAMTNVLGPFTGRLANSGEKLELRNNSGRLMDSVDYGVDGNWPVAPDGSGVSLSRKRDALASIAANNWTQSEWTGGSPGRLNFPEYVLVITNTTPQAVSGTWKYNASGDNLGTEWQETEFDDSLWSSGQGLFQAGDVPPPTGAIEPLTTLFSTGIGEDGSGIPAGFPDPHYLLTSSAYKIPPPPAIPATVIQHHPAWLGNDSASRWIGPLNPGLTDLPTGNYHYRTTFSLDGFDPKTANLRLRFLVDNDLTSVLLNGFARNLTYEGFATWSAYVSLTNGFSPGTNTIDFLTRNSGNAANPVGFRVHAFGTARRQHPVLTSLPSDRTSYHFRHTFVLDGAPSLSSLKLNTLIADGAVFYLNGTEVLRVNLPLGTISSDTLAVTNTSNPTWLGPIMLPNSALRTGTNTLAVAVHSAIGPIADVLFGASLDLTLTNGLPPTPPRLVLNEIPAPDSDFWVELMNAGPHAAELEGCVIVMDGTTTNRTYRFPSQSLAGGSHLSVGADRLGWVPTPGDRLFLFGPGQTNVLDAAVVPGRNQARWPDGGGSWMYPSALSPGQSNRFEFNRDIVINEILYHAPLLPPSPSGYSSTMILSITNEWKFHSLGVDLGTTWRHPAFDDSDWPSGRALFYYTPSLLPADKNTPLSLQSASGNPVITFYFRSPFVFSGATNGAQLVLRPVVDDGAVYYLNGLEIFRQNLPAGEIRYTNFTSTGVATPVFSGPFFLEVTNLVQGTNLLAVEVHQFTTNPIAADVAFGAEVSLLGQLVSPLPARESPESWIELFNRGSDAIDLTGWRFSSGIDFRFAQGTMLGAGDYLVVAKDPDYMRSNYPGLNVLGPFTNRLSFRSDRLVLKDRFDNTTDEVHYFDKKPWPTYPDGGGSSLELRNPWADNERPESWAASLESSRSSWSTYTYRGIAENILGPTIWNEFVMGLLDAGECLIDDLRVIESPNTSPVDLLQNGSFETGLSAWRALGTHGRSRVEADTDDPANHVLHLVTTGPTDHLHNHLETTLTSNRSVTDGREYEISFRAKWLAGNNRLNTRLYFNRVSSTSVLPLPSRRGTPGKRNSTFSDQLGPTFVSLNHSPILPRTTDQVTITTSLSDPHGIKSVRLWWSTNSLQWQAKPMNPEGPDPIPGYEIHSAAIGPFPPETMAQFFVEATDGLDNTAAFPAGGTNSRALIWIDSGTLPNTRLHRLRLLMTATDAELLHAPTNVMSEDRLGATILADDRTVYYDAGIHLQGSQRGRNSPGRVGFNIRFPSDRLFRGNQDTMTIDRSGGYSGLGGKHDEILLWHAVNHAGGGLLGLDCDLVQIFAPRERVEDTGLLRRSGFDNDYFDNQFDQGGDGSTFRLELIYYPLTSYGGDPQAPKLPQPDEVINVDIQNWGNSPENYRWIFIQEGHADADDYSRVIAVNQAFSSSGTTFDTRTRQLLDVDQYMRALAFKAFTGEGDTYTGGLNHNWKLYFPPAEGKMLGLLWDMDFAFVAAVDAPFPGSGSPNTHRLVLLPDNHRRYCNHLLDLLTTTINADYLRPWANHYANLLGQDWNRVVDYLQQRANFIRSSLPLNTAFAITSNGGANFSVSNSPATIVGTAPMMVKSIEVNGISQPITWTSLTAWSLSIPLASSANFLTLQGVDSQGKRLTNALDSIVITNTGVSSPRPVLINEWAADNAGPGGLMDPADGRFQDWFELFNPNDSAVDLSAWYITDDASLPAKWQIPANTVIGPRAFLLVWADGEPLQNGLGDSLDLHADFQLSRNGEFLGLFSADLVPQHTLIFGPQSQNISQGLFPDGDTNTVYSMLNWTPRASNSLGAPPAPLLDSLSVQPDATLSLKINVISGRTYRIEYSDSLSSPLWNVLGENRTATGPEMIISDPIKTDSKRFYRVVLLP